MRALTSANRGIPIAGPSITEKEVEYVADAARRAWYGDANLYHERFERAFASLAQRTHAIALPSCTSALHLALLSLGVGVGDEVAIPDTTWIASAAPISYVGAAPVFVDVEPDSWCISADSLDRALTPATKAVIVVDLYGNMPDWSDIVAVTRERGIAVIEDAAEAVGARYDGRPAGSFGEVSAFSFHGSKTLTTGEGGMLLTNDTSIYERCLFLRDHGRRPGDTSFRSEEIAYKYKMSSMQAALGLAQIERIGELVSKKRAIFTWYREILAAGPLAEDGLMTLNAELPRVTNSYWMVTAILSPELRKTKDHVIAELAVRGIDSRPFFDPLSSLDAYRDLPEARAAADRNTVSYRLAPYGINLPSALSLTEDDVGNVCAALGDILGVT